MNQYTGVFEQVGAWWTGYVEELPGCNVQEATLGEARESLREAIHLIVEANRELARREAEGHGSSGSRWPSPSNETDGPPSPPGRLRLPTAARRRPALGLLESGEPEDQRGPEARGDR